MPFKGVRLPIYALNGKNGIAMPENIMLRCGGSSKQFIDRLLSSNANFRQFLASKKAILHVTKKYLGFAYTSSFVG